MDQQHLFGLALGITSPWFIERIEFSVQQKRLDIHIDFKPGSRFPVSEATGEHPVHDTTLKTWRHLNFFQHECYLHCRTPRVKTPDGRVQLIHPPWSGKSSGFTLLFEALLMQLLTAMPALEVSKLVNVSDDKLWRMLGRYVDLAREELDFKGVTAVGIDETSRRKGHDYITLFVDLEERKTIYIAEGKDSATIPCFLLDFCARGGAPDNIQRLSMDMSPAFISGAASCLPKAEITFDRFHIMKLINEAVDEVRREEVKTEPLLRNARYAILKNRENLTEAQAAQRMVIEKNGFRLKTYKAMRMREFFQEAYKQNTAIDFRERLYDWYWWASHSRIAPIQRVAKTLRKHWVGVINWVHHKESNGVLEGLNSLIQSAKSRARGYSTLKNLKTIAYLITGKLDFTKVNPSFVT